MTGRAGWCYLGGGTADGQGSVRQTGSRRLVDIAVTRHGAGAQTSQDLLQAQHDLIATLRLREEEEGDLTSANNWNFIHESRRTSASCYKNVHDPFG